MTKKERFTEGPIKKGGVNPKPSTPKPEVAVRPQVSKPKPIFKGTTMKCETCEEDMQHLEPGIALCPECMQLQVESGGRWVPVGPAPAPHYLIVPLAFMDAIHVLQSVVFKSWSLAAERDWTDPGKRTMFMDLVRSIQHTRFSRPFIEALNFQYDEFVWPKDAPGSVLRWCVKPTATAVMCSLDMKLDEPLDRCAQRMVLQMFDERQTFNKPFDLFATAFTDSNDSTVSHADTVMRLTRKKSEETT